MMSEIEILYETIFCSQYGMENRERLIEDHKDKMPELKKAHGKYGIKMNGKAISLSVFEKI